MTARVLRYGVAVAAMMGSLLSGTVAANAAEPSLSVSSQPKLGVLQPLESRAVSSRSAGIDLVMLEPQWRELQPTPARKLDPTAVAKLRAQYDAYRRAGLDIVFAPGLQDLPTWVFDLDADTRFVDQYGIAWHGQPGEEVADAVWNPNVRAAQTTYLKLLKSALTGMTFAGVRAGGLLNGELRYPDQALPRHSFWAFSKWAQKKNPVPGWIPGTKDPVKAKKFLNWYLASLVSYQTYIVGQTQLLLPGTPVLVLYPNVGLRPGQADAAVATSLNGSTLAENNNTLSQGLDWARQVAALPKSGVLAYQTSVDRAGTGTTPQTEAPVAYLKRLATAAGIGIAGENGGSNTPDEVDRAYRNARAYGLSMMFIMNEADLYSGRADRPSLRQVQAIRVSQNVTSSSS